MRENLLMSIGTKSGIDRRNTRGFPSETMARYSSKSNECEMLRSGNLITVKSSKLSLALEGFFQRHLVP